MTGNAAARMTPAPSPSPDSAAAALAERRAAARAKQAEIEQYVRELPPEGRLIPTQMKAGYPNTWLFDLHTRQPLPAIVSIQRAGREVKANQLDVQRELDVPIRSWHDASGRAHFYNGGPFGLAAADFLAGEGTDLPDEKIGRFHEGLGVALNVLLDLGREPRVETIGMTITGVRLPAVEYGGKVITYLKVVPNNRTEGTDWSFACSPAEFRAIQSLFLVEVATEEIAPGVHVPADGMPTALYSRGVRIMDFGPLLYTYDLKELAYYQGRDRDVVNTDYALRLIADRWRHMNSLTPVRRYFQVLKEAVDRRRTPAEKEYQVSIAYDSYGYARSSGLQHPDIWRAAFQEVWGTERVVLASEAACDFAAAIQGYTVLHVPAAVKVLLKWLGVQESTVVGEAKAGLLAELAGGRRVIEFPLTARRKGTIVEAGREAIRNARFYGETVSVRYEPDEAAGGASGYLVIENSGAETIRVEHLAIGEGVERRHREQFHEGLARMLLTLACENRDATVKGAGITLRPAMRRHRVLANLVCLHVDVLPGKRTSGAKVRFRCSPAEYEATTSAFLSLDPVGDEARTPTCRLVPQPYLAVDGEVIERNVNALFGWDFAGRGLLEHGRAAVNHARMLTAMKTALAALDDENLVARYLTAWRQDPDALEYQCGNVRPRRAVKRLWAEIAAESLGNLALSVSPEVDAIAQDRGFTIVSHVPAPLLCLLPQLGILDSARAMVRAGQQPPFQPEDLVPDADLSPAERERLDTLRTSMAWFDPAFPWDAVQIVTRFTRPDLADAQGICVRRSGQVPRIYLTRGILSSQETLDAVFHEEYVHWLNRANRDFSRPFQHQCNQHAARLLAMVRTLKDELEQLRAENEHLRAGAGR